MGKSGSKRRITIRVSNQVIPINIEPEEEEFYRAAETALRIRINELGSAFKRPEDQDIILAAIAYELMLEKKKYEKEADQIGKEIDRVLSKLDM